MPASRIQMLRHRPLLRAGFDFLFARWRLLVESRPAMLAVLHIVQDRFAAGGAGAGRFRRRRIWHGSLWGRRLLRNGLRRWAGRRYWRWGLSVGAVSGTGAGGATGCGGAGVQERVAQERGRRRSGLQRLDGAAALLLALSVAGAGKSPFQRLAGTQLPDCPFLKSISGLILPLRASCFSISEEIGPRSTLPTRTYHSIGMVQPFTCTKKSTRTIVLVV